MSLQVIRPGIRLGNYPERQPAASAVSIGSLFNSWRECIDTGRRNFNAFSATLSAIEAAEQQLRSGNYAGITQQQSSLVREVRRHGLNEERAVRIFAAVRIAATDKLGLSPYAEQLYAGWSMLHGSIVEMNTGEGKTLTAALPAIAVALTGTPVHIITVNEYLVERDAGELSSLYAEFGLTVATITDRMHDAERRVAYGADIVYCTNKQIVFDYLRDQQTLKGARHGLSSELRTLLTKTTEQPLLRGLCFAIVDEADSVLIDDARTPLILAEPQRPDRALTTEATIALSMAKTLHSGVDFQLQQDNRSVWLTDTGSSALRRLAERLSGVWRFDRYRNERVRQALCAQYLYRLDRDYLVRQGRVELIDETTGRVMPDRKLQHGLHRMLEIKESCAVTDENQIISTISFQQFFARYCHLTGMSGTVREVRRELQQVYNTRVVRIPVHRANQHKHLPAIVASNNNEQLEHLITSISARHATGQPILIGTRSVIVSERISIALSARNIKHSLLNARQDANESRIVAQAGQIAAITVATNMAGRGTDIPLDHQAKTLGGLHVISFDINESSRCDRQLFGRAARQGDPGSGQSILSLRDELIVNAIPLQVLFFVSRAINRLPALGRPLAYLTIRYAQSVCERRHAAQRIAVFKGGDRLKRLLAISGELE